MVNTRSKTDDLQIWPKPEEVLTKVSGPSSTSGKIGRTELPGDVKEPEKKRRCIAEGESDAHRDTPARRPEDRTLEALPMDIVLEIISYLHPLDLLRLARTSRIFRNLLISKNSRHIWRAARLALDINVPECPPDQSEPQWARLLLDPICPTCDATDSTRVEWGLRVRGCRVCLEEILISGSEVPRAFPGSGAIESILDLLPFARRPLQCKCRQGPHAHLSTKQTDRQYHRPAIQPMIDRYQSLRRQVLARTPGAKAQFNTFVAQRKESIAIIFDEEEQLKSWEYEQVQLRKQKVREEIAKWKQLYQQELIALGYHPLDASCAVEETSYICRYQQELIALGYHPLDASCAAGETSYMIRHEDGWERNRPFLEAAASRAKKHRIAWRRSTFDTLCKDFLAQKDQKAPIRGLWPSARDLLNAGPEIEEIIQNGDGQSYQVELKSVFPPVLERWWESWEEVLAKKVFDFKLRVSPVNDLEDNWPSLNQDKPSEEDLVLSFASLDAEALGSARQAILELAKSVFTCQGQATGWLKDFPLYWEGGLLNYQCPQEISRRRSSGIMEFPKMEFDVLTSNQVDVVCAVLGLDANQARFRDLDDLDARFRCVTCPHKSRIMNWRVAVKHRHERGKIPQRFPPTFVKISDEEAVIVRAFELARPNRSCPLGRIRSSLCDKAFYTTNELLYYLRAKHNQTELTPDNYWIDPSIPPKPVLETDVFMIKD